MLKTHLFWGLLLMVYLIQLGSLPGVYTPVLAQSEGQANEQAQEIGDLGIPLSPKGSPLTVREVRSILHNAAISLDVPMTIAVVDRVGKILGIFKKDAAPDQVPGNFFQETQFVGGDRQVGELQDAVEVAVAAARTAAFFSNNQAPLSSRTIRFISGIHFPPGISFTPNAALYGIENTNRGCDFNVEFNPGQALPQPKSAASLFDRSPCHSVDKSGCGLGILTGKPDLLDSDFRAVNTGGVPIFRNIAQNGETKAVLIGGIGISGDFADALKEFAALSGITSLTNPGFQFPASDASQVTGIFPAPDVGLAVRSLVVFIDGIRLPFVDRVVLERLLRGQRPEGTLPGSLPVGAGECVLAPQDAPTDPENLFVEPPIQDLENLDTPQQPPSTGQNPRDPLLTCFGSAEEDANLGNRQIGSCYAPSLDADGNRICLQAPEGYVVGPVAGSQLSRDEVERMIRQALATANRTRAVIRLPIGNRTRMVFAVSDVDGRLLAVFRMPDATLFSVDVATAKSRNVAYFSSLDPNATADLRDAEQDQPGLPPGTAVTNRTISFGSQPFYPAGIDGSQAGPFFQSLYVRDTLFACSQGNQQLNPNQNGIVFFPGSLPVYKAGVLVGGLGVSGDGVEQDDFVTVGGATGFEPPDSIRADQFRVRRVRSAYLKFPRNPER